MSTTQQLKELASNGRQLSAAAKGLSPKSLELSQGLRIGVSAMTTELEKIAANIESEATGIIIGTPVPFSELDGEDYLDIELRSHRGDNAYAANSDETVKRHKDDPSRIVWVVV